MLNQDYYAAIRQNIEESGQHLQGVFPTVDDPCTPFIYTIGNALSDLPELIIVGNFEPRVVAMILNEVGEIMRKSGEPLPDVVDVGGTFPIHVREASDKAKSEWTIQAGQYLRREDYKVQQLLLCDPTGVYPGEPGCDPGYDVELI